MKPPLARRAGADPYAWLHDVSSPETLSYLADERAYYDASVAHLVPLHQRMAQEMLARLPDEERTPHWSLTRFSYYTRWTSDSDYPDLLQVDTEIGVEKVVLSLESLVSPDSDYLETGLIEVSPDERLIAYSVDHSGDEVYTLKFRDLSTGADLPDVIDRSYYGGAWTSDSAGFLYTVHDDAYRPYQVWFHRLGSDPSADRLLWQEDDERFEVNVRAARVDGWIIVSAESNTTAEQWLVDAHDPVATLRSVGGRREGVKYSIDLRPDDVLLLSDADAVESALWRAPYPPAAGQDHSAWTLVRPERAAEQLLAVDAWSGAVVLHVRSGGASCLRLLPHDNLAAEGLLITPLYDGGELTVAEQPMYHADTIVVGDQSWIHPVTWSALDLATGTRQHVFSDEVPGFAAEDYLTERHEFPSTDGATVPALVIRHRDTPLDGTAPALVFGYGAYGYSWPSEWDPALPSLLDRGVVWVHAHVRGGGYLGRAWYLDGKLAHKQHTFDDQLAVADGLAAGGLVDPDRIATRGLSAGGLLQGAVFSQRPERWAAVVAEVPFVDVVTTMYDASTPLTVTEWEEWGNPAIPEQLAYLSAYSPYVNPPPAGGRPALLVTGSVHDPRVMVREPAKWTALLRHTDPDWSASKCWFRCELGAGAHTGPSGRRGHLAYEAEIYAWVLSQLGIAGDHDA